VTVVVFSEDQNTDYRQLIMGPFEKFDPWINSQ
jgi:hypothetical protein